LYINRRGEVSTMELVMQVHAVVIIVLTAWGALL
jgi:hypothetical protein